MQIGEMLCAKAENVMNPVVPTVERSHDVSHRQSVCNVMINTQKLDGEKTYLGPPSCAGMFKRDKFWWLLSDCYVNNNRGACRVFRMGRICPSAPSRREMYEMGFVIITQVQRQNENIIIKVGGFLFLLVLFNNR